MLDFQKLSATYQQALLRQAVPFWLKYGRDTLCGGYFDQLTNTGGVVDADKSVVMQAQQTWAFAWLYNTFDGQTAWLDHAKHGATFLSQFAHDTTLSCYAQLDRRGYPAAPSTNIIPDCYVVMAYAQLYRATKADEWAMLAKQTFTNLLVRWERVNSETNQSIGGFRQLQHLSEPIAVLKALLEIQPLLDEEEWKESVETVLQKILREFVDRRSDVLHEFILPGSGFLNTPEGRRLNVGLTYQLAVFLLDLCAQTGNRKLALQAVMWCLHVGEQAWDGNTGGLNQYVDAKNQPGVFPDGQQKWAWVHLEAITALAKGYLYTQHPDCLKMLKRIHDFTFQYFPDPNHLGWHVVIDDNRQPLLQVRSTQTIGCFSMLRCLAETAQTLTKCNQLQPASRTVRTF